MKIMKTLNIVGQKVKGEAQNIKGKIEVKSGQRVKGTVDQVKGKINIASADIKSEMV